MASKAKKKQGHDYPFVFFNHGLWGYSDEIATLQVSIVFRSDVLEGDRSILETSAPPPIGSVHGLQREAHVALHALARRAV